MSKKKETPQQDSRFAKFRDKEKFFCKMCKECGLCCLGRDWSTDWMGQRVGICNNLNIETGSCVDETKKSIVCRSHVCVDIEHFTDRFIYIASRNCPTANKLLGEFLTRNKANLTKEEFNIMLDTIYGDHFDSVGSGAV